MHDYNSKYYNMKNKYHNFYKASRPVRGFVLPFTMLIAALILLVTGTSMTLLSKQFYFSRLYKQGQLANYAADDALACALAVDDGFLGADGLGIFPSGTSVSAMTYIQSVIDHINLSRTTPISINDIECSQSLIFQQTAPISFSTSTDYYVYTYTDPNNPPATLTELGVTSSYNMKMPLGTTDPVSGLPMYRCAKVTVNKTQSFRQIIAQGYSQCDNRTAAVERAVVNTTASN